ncbi:MULTISPECIES: cupredoxin domain-containing protein [Bacillales]|jgi:heme/copper-type cytochrome/quinol oxidase subunit 2|uniref:Quinol oxidase n=1 Tax=Brevibacillus aydinogluensis TaxID=927786 RepID=A0AA48RBD5_9BACL|nr:MULTISPECIES: cupredoxin domain-containing protein [Bacillales]REK65240.1 MAG: quinol oxidase [Brevibacillus sp.]MBR8658785.1 cupredoxin domain-containing protein [Brevibacillus sp. NL20B1]MDT3415900.1 heme/copper-type cytochrome/quinol oxidase subunit 2 [Brevibacillus aydinogluensis]NNV04464.1 quinol oxidase [Brevibacillus sp. MCWH]UFJ61648.1 cupredoxin domain-containing protein [Anoxybacillus sediminis]
MKKMWGFMISAAVLSVMLAGCGGDKQEASQGNSQPAAAEASTAINIEASNWKFNQDTFEVKAGEPFTINFKSTEGFHGIGIEGLDVDIQNEGSKTLTVDKPGEYKIFCNVLCGPDHGKMLATLVVK